MYPIMIVDDEKAIREYLPRIINFEEYGFKVCATAKNGEEAFEKMKQFRPQLIFLDVCMPVMDGLAFLKKLREETEDYEPHIIMLSGYNEFEYARTAIRYGVKAYLTKPLEEAELGDILQELKTELDNKLLKRDSEDMYNRVRYLQELYHSGDGDRSSCKGYYMLHCVILGAAVMQEETYQIIRSCIEEGEHGGKTRLFRSRGSVFSYLISPQVLENYQNSITLFGRHILYQLKKDGVESALLFDDTLFCQTESTFRNDYDTHLYQMLTEVFWGRETLFRSSQCVAANYEQRLEKEELYVDKLKRAIHESDREVLEEVFRGLVGDCKEFRLNLIILQEVNYRIHYALQEVVGEEGYERLIKPIDWRDAPCLYNYQDWETALWEQISCAFVGAEEQKKQQGSGMVDKLLEYTRAHFKEQLSLKELADMYFVTPSYLGRCFQKVTGVGFKQYLNQLRIEEAKLLLARTDKMVYEVAEEVGFTESKYFVSKFTAQVGKTPLEYRKAVQSSLKYQN